MKFERLDQAFVAYLTRHVDLLLAVLATGLVFWAIIEHHAGYVPEVCVIGAISFFIGFIPSLGCAAAFGGLHVALLLAGGHRVDLSALMMMALGYGCVAWLGFRHREAKRRETERRDAATVPVSGSVIPWAVANEIRSSLAAVRFLLFPLQTQAGQTEADQPIAQATAELSRLEALFNRLSSPERDT